MSNIIIPREGIDPKAKTGALIGMAEIILKDADTGKVKEVVRQKNMLTNALNSIFNKPPYGFGDAKLNNVVSVPTVSHQPIINTALGGILLFPHTLGNDADMMYPDFDSNYPTGYASVSSYTQEDSRQGAYDAVSSGAITNGFRHVYTWGSAFGNGTIASVALSHKNCHKYFNDLSNLGILRVADNNNLRYIGNVTPHHTNNAWLIGANSKGLFFNGGYGSYESFPSTPIVNKWKKKVYDVDLLFDNITFPADDFEDVFTYPAWGFFCVDEDYLYYIRVTSSTSSSSTFTLYTIDLDDYESVTQTDYTVAANLLSNAGYKGDTFAKRGNYIYLFKANQASVYKINLNNAADVTEIELPSGLTTPAAFGMSVVKDIIMGFGFIIGTDDVARASTGINGFRMFNTDGVWCVYGSNAVGAGIVTPFTASHADLQTSVTKTADKQMIVNYSIIQS